MIAQNISLISSPSTHTKSNDDSLFLPAPFFMVRSPLLPLEDFFALLESEDVTHNLFSFYRTEQLIREAIAIASPSLYKAILSQTEKKEKKKQQITSSLLKYFLRMTSRSTPFGLFSFVSMGSWGNMTFGNFDFKNIRKRARPDMGWLLTIIDQLCSDPSLLPFVPIKCNPLLFESRGRIFLNYFQNKINLKNEESNEEQLQKTNETEKVQLLSIRSSFLTQAIFEITKHPISITQLIEQLIQKFPSLEKDKLQKMIEKLLKDQFLCFTLQPSLLTESPLSDLLSKLSSISLSDSSLREISSQIESYNQIPIGQGEAYIQKAHATMEKMIPSQNPLQVDTAYLGKEILLPVSIGKELGQAAEVLWRLSFVQSISHPLRSYHEKFLDKYGTYRLVPLLELLNEERGLGVPESYLSNSFEKSVNNPITLHWTNWLKNQWIQCLRKKQKEIEITEEVLDKLLGKPEKEKAMLSFDLYCKVFANSPSQIDSGEYTLLLSNFSWQAGATFGRFLDLLGEQVKQKVKTFLYEEENLETTSLFTESSYLPSSARSANVSVHPNLRQYVIDLGTHENNLESISLDKIYVGAMQDRFYLTQKGQLKELNITTGNMLNSNFAPTPFRFIRDIYRFKYQVIGLFPWRDLEEAPFLPRVRFKKTILSPAQWKLDLAQLDISTKENLDVIENKFLEWAQEWELPRYLFITDDDNYILLDKEHPVHRREIAIQLKKRQQIRFVEKIGQAQGQWLKSQRGTHFSEFVVPFVKNKKYSPTVERFMLSQHVSITDNVRWKLPGSEWLYVKCYLSEENENRFLVDHLFNFTELLLQQGIIKDWFFVRYKDPLPHIRIRFRVEKETIFSQLLPIFHHWSSSLFEEKQIKDIVLATYEREVERYGGEHLIDSAEALFSVDSITTGFLIQEILKKRSSFPEEIIVTLSCIDLLKSVGFNRKEQISFFSSMGISKEELKGFRQWKSTLLLLGEAILEDTLFSHQDAFFLCEAFESRKKTFISFANKMAELAEKNLLTIPPQIILNSILHMHCNRLIGREVEKEKKVRRYAYYTLAALEQKSVNQPIS